MATFVEINNATDFTKGEPFATPDEVREYFTVDNLAKRVSVPPDQYILDEYAREVIERGWHMEPFRATVYVCGAPVSRGGALDEIWHYLQGFRSHERCTLVRQTVRAGLVAREQKTGDQLYSGTVRQVMDWIDEVLKVEDVETGSDPGDPGLSSVHPWNHPTRLKSRAACIPAQHTSIARSA